MKSIQVELSHLVNLTPHTLNILGNEVSGEVAIVPPSGVVARVTVLREEADSVGQISLWQNQSGEVTGLEGLELKGGQDYILITSLMAKSAVHLAVHGMIGEAYEEGDAPTVRVVSPGELVRNEAGQPIGCRGLDW